MPDGQPPDESNLHVVGLTFVSMQRELEYAQKELAECRARCAELMSKKRKRKQPQDAEKK